MDFKRFLSIMEHLDAGNGVVLSLNEEDDIMSRPVFLPQMELGLPTVTKVGKIAMLIKDKNPIMLQMSDGTRLMFSYDQFKRITGTPKVGRTITIVFQREGTDRTNMPSQIVSASVT